MPAITPMVSIPSSTTSHHNMALPKGKKRKGYGPGTLQKKRRKLARMTTARK